MAAVTPGAAHHAHLPPLASRFVDAAAIPWQKTAYPGIETKTLLVEPESGLMTMLMRMAPGARLPDHEHVRIEQTYVLEGSLVCNEGECKPGEFVWRPAGSRHDAWGGPAGGVMLAMFLIPNKFFPSAGREVDFLGRDWDEVWGAALFSPRRDAGIAA